MSARDLLRQVQALPEAERQQFLEGVEALLGIQPTPKTMKALDFTAYWTLLQSLGLPALDAAETQAFDRCLAGEANLRGLHVPALLSFA